MGKDFEIMNGSLLGLYGSYLEVSDSYYLVRVYEFGMDNNIRGRIWDSLKFRHDCRGIITLLFLSDFRVSDNEIDLEFGFDYVFLGFSDLGVLESEYKVLSALFGTNDLNVHYL